VLFDTDILVWIQRGNHRAAALVDREEERENIGHRAAIYIEEYSLSHGLWAGDAIIVATATDNNLTLCTGNLRHYRPIKELKVRVFKP
jgi:predicted nucleic acid-binding protein